MKSETTLLEIYKWLSEGKKISRYGFQVGYFLQVVNNVLVDNEGDEVLYNFIAPATWYIYQEPEEKVKWCKVTWYKVTYFTKCQSRPYTTNAMYRSKQDFLNGTATEESDYHFIILEEVKCECSFIKTINNH